MLAWRTVRELRALVVDIENRPLSYWYDGNPTAEITVIAYKWLDSTKTKVLLADGRNATVRSILEQFRPVYEKAGVVIGHNVRRHDLPILSGAYFDTGQQRLGSKLTIDTYKDLPRWKDVPKSLDHLADFLECPLEKPHMSQHKWREANRFTEAGLRLARKRCATDVRITEWCYRELVRRGWLNVNPKVWSA